MADPAEDNVVALFPTPVVERIKHLDPEYEIELRRRIMLSQYASMATEEERARNKKVFDGPLQRLRVPRVPVVMHRDLHVGPGEQVEIYEGNTLKRFQLVQGEVTYLPWRRVWDIYPKIHEELRGLGLPENIFWEVMYALFPVVPGAMSVPFKEENGQRFVLCGIRSKLLDTKNVGEMSFPAGLVKPEESLEAAVRRELFREGFVRLALFYPGWVVFDWPDVPSVTFGRLLRVEAEDAMPTEGCYEAEGKKFVWQLLSEVAAFLAGGDGASLIKRFDELGVPVPLDSEGKPHLVIANDAAHVLGTFLGLFLRRR